MTVRQALCTLCILGVHQDRVKYIQSKSFSHITLEKEILSPDGLSINFPRPLLLRITIGTRPPDHILPPDFIPTRQPPVTLFQEYGTSLPASVELVIQNRSNEPDGMERREDDRCYLFQCT